MKGRFSENKKGAQNGGFCKGRITGVLRLNEARTG
jgi:hypothetical protein